MLLDISRIVMGRAHRVVVLDNMLIPFKEFARNAVLLVLIAFRIICAPAAILPPSILISLE